MFFNLARVTNAAGCCGSQFFVLVHVEIVVEELHAGSCATSRLLHVELTTGVLWKPPDIGRLQEFPGRRGGIRADVGGIGLAAGLLAAVVLTDAQVAQEIGEDVVAAGRCPLPGGSWQLPDVGLAIMRGAPSVRGGTGTGQRSCGRGCMWLLLWHLLLRWLLALQLLESIPECCSILWRTLGRPQHHLGAIVAIAAGRRTQRGLRSTARGAAAAAAGAAPQCRDGITLAPSGLHFVACIAG